MNLRQARVAGHGIFLSIRPHLGHPIYAPAALVIKFHIERKG